MSKDFKIDRMRYQRNALSFWLCLLAIACNAAAMIILYEYRPSGPNIVNDIIIGLDVLLNILFMLFVFLGAEKSKAYQFNWGIKLIVIAAVQVVRVFIAPLIYFTRGQFTLLNFLLDIGLLLASAAALVAAAVICLIKSKKLISHIKSLEKGDE